MQIYISHVASTREIIRLRLPSKKKRKWPWRALTCTDFSQMPVPRCHRAVAWGLISRRQEHHARSLHWNDPRWGQICLQREDHLKFSWIITEYKSRQQYATDSWVLACCGLASDDVKVPQQAQQEVKKAHHQIYGSKQWIRPLPVAANVASQYEGKQNLLVPESQNN